MAMFWRPLVLLNSASEPVAMLALPVVFLKRGFKSQSRIVNAGGEAKESASALGRVGASIAPVRSRGDRLKGRTKRKPCEGEREREKYESAPPTENRNK